MYTCIPTSVTTLRFTLRFGDYTVITLRFGDYTVITLRFGDYTVITLRFGRFYSNYA